MAATYTNNLNLAKPAYGDSADVGVINGNMDTLDTYCHDTRFMGAHAYNDQGTTYAIGEYCIYLGHYYRCTGATSGAWDSTKWVQTTIGDELEDIASGQGVSDMTGATASTAGTHGLVPAPAAGDQDKVLMGSGTWEDIPTPAADLADLDDVDITTPTGGQVLTYDDTNDEWVNADAPEVTKTVSGNPVEFDDGADAPLVKCVSAITGSQDLHGYDKPWVGGAGKNKFDSTLMVNPTTSAKWVQVTLKANTAYTVSSDIPDSYISAYIFAIAGTDTSSVTSGTNGVGSGRPQYITTGSDGIISFGYRTSGASGSLNLDDYTYQIEEGSTATTFAPYSNICPITAYTEGEIEVRGKNAVDFSTPYMSGYGLTADGSISQNNNYNLFKTFLASGDYICSRWDSSSSVTQVTTRIASYNSNDTIVGEIFYVTNASDTNRHSVAFSVPEGSAYTLISVRITNYDIQVEKGTTATDYEPYKGTTHTTTFPSAIYRGSEDVVNGEVTKEWTCISLTDLTWDIRGEHIIRATLPEAAVYISSYTKVDAVCSNYNVTAQNGSTAVGNRVSFNTATQIYLTDLEANFTDAQSVSDRLSGATLAYPLATPQTLSVTPTNLPVKSINGYNHIESSKGDMEVEYIAKAFSPITELVDSQISALQKMMELMLTSARETTMVASANYTAGTLIVACGAFYKATTAISSGASLVVGTNITPTTIAAEIAALA